jgi:transcriptional regulator with XRE-family HTH domain
MEKNFFATGLTAIIHRKGIPRKALAAKAKRNEKTIGRIEKGEGSAESRQAIATALNMPPEDIEAFGRKIIQRKMLEMSTTVKRGGYELSEISDPEALFYALAGSIRSYGYSRTSQSLEEGPDMRLDLEQVGRLKDYLISLTCMAPCDPVFKSASIIERFGQILTSLKNDRYVLFIGADEPGSRIVHFAQEESIRKKTDDGPRKYFLDLTDPNQEKIDEMMAQEMAELSGDPRSF